MQNHHTLRTDTLLQTQNYRPRKKKHFQPQRQNHPPSTLYKFTRYIAQNYLPEWTISATMWTQSSDKTTIEKKKKKKKNLKQS